MTIQTGTWILRTDDKAALDPVSANGSVASPSLQYTHACPFKPEVRPKSMVRHFDGNLDWEFYGLPEIIVPGNYMVIDGSLRAKIASQGLHRRGVFATDIHQPDLFPGLDKDDLESGKAVLAGKMNVFSQFIRMEHGITFGVRQPFKPGPAFDFPGYGFSITLSFYFDGVEERTELRIYYGVNSLESEIIPLHPPFGTEPHELIWQYSYLTAEDQGGGIYEGIVLIQAAFSWNGGSVNLSTQVPYSGANSNQLNTCVDRVEFFFEGLGLDEMDEPEHRIDEFWFSTGSTSEQQCNCCEIASPFCDIDTEEFPLRLVGPGFSNDAEDGWTVSSYNTPHLKDEDLTLFTNPNPPPDDPPFDEWDHFVSYGSRLLSVPESIKTETYRRTGFMNIEFHHNLPIDAPPFSVQDIIRWQIVAFPFFIEAGWNYNIDNTFFNARYIFFRGFNGIGGASNTEVYKRPESGRVYSLSWDIWIEEWFGNPDNPSGVYSGILRISGGEWDRTAFSTGITLNLQPVPFCTFIHGPTISGEDWVTVPLEPWAKISNFQETVF